MRVTDERDVLLGQFEVTRENALASEIGEQVLAQLPRGLGYFQPTEKEST